METLIPFSIIFIVLAVLFLGIHYGRRKSLAREKNETSRQVEETRDILANIQKSGQLPVISNASVILQGGESAVLMARSQLLEERAIRRAGHVGFRVARGVWIGGTQSESHGELRIVDSGSLVLTTQRLIFLGTLRTSEILLKKIADITRSLEMIQINIAGKTKAQIFSLSNPLIWEVLTRTLTESVHSGSLRLPGPGIIHEDDPMDPREIEADERETEADELDAQADKNVDQERYTEAELLCRKALAIREQVFGSNHPDIAASFNLLGHIYMMQDRYADAEPFYLRALAIHEQALGPKASSTSHYIVAQELNHLGVVYTKLARYNDAESFFQRAIDILERALGPDDTSVANSLVANYLLDYANLLTLSGRETEAKTMVARSNAILAKHEEQEPTTDEFDEMYRQAVDLVITTRQVSISLIQRRLGIGFNRAARVVERMEREGIVGPIEGRRPREVLAEKPTMSHPS